MGINGREIFHLEAYKLQDHSSEIHSLHEVVWKQCSHNKKPSFAGKIMITTSHDSANYDKN